MPVQPKIYIDRLVKALAEHKRYYNISRKRYYSERMGRYCMKYCLEDRQKKGVKFEVFNQIEILKYLVREFSEVTGREVPEACLQPLDDKEPEPKKKKETRGRPRNKTILDNLCSIHRVPRKKTVTKDKKKTKKDTKEETGF